MKLIAAIFNLVLLSMLSLFFSCGKKNTCVAGSGGQVTLVCLAQHHTLPIYNYSKPGYPDSAMIKFSPPSGFVPTSDPTLYDIVATGNSGDDFVNVPGLKCGDYFIFMTGWDSAKVVRVKGGIPYTLTATSGSVSVPVPISE